MRLFFTFCFFLFSFSALSSVSSTGNSAKDFVPPGYFIYVQKEADLNGDKLNDVVLVLSPDWEKLDQMYRPEGEKRNRILVILFKTAEGKYNLSALKDNFILNKSDGGMMGDPFYGEENLQIVKNVLSFNFSGGSGMGHWGYTVKLRWQNNNWYLIGFTSNDLDIQNGGKMTETDVNWNTGLIIKSAGTEADDRLKKVSQVTKKLPPITLQDFDIEKIFKMIH